MNTHKNTVSLLFFIMLFHYSWQVFSQSTEQAPYFTQDTSNWILAEYTENTEKYGDNPDYLVKHSLLANRKRNRIEISAIATGVEHSQPVEFFIVSECGKDYESLAISQVKPSDIIEALIFIGMQPGYTANVAKNRFAPKGERVKVTFNWRANALDQPSFIDQSVRVEQLLTDARWKKTLPLQGLRFTGSTWRPVSADSTELKCMADEYCEIAAVFNSPWAIFDVPRNAPQGAVYGSIQPNPDFSLLRGQRLNIVIEPEYTDGSKRIIDYVLNVKDTPGSRGIAAADLIYTLSQVEGPNKNKIISGTFDQTIDQFHNVIKKGKEVYIKTEFDGSLSVNLIKDIVSLINPIVDKNLIIVEYHQSEIYYRAFLPNDMWRDPSKRGRPDQPIEIHISNNSSDKAGSYKLIYYDNIPKNQQIAGYESTTQTFEELDELIAFLNSKNPWSTNGVFVFLGEKTEYKTLLDVYQKIRGQFPTLFVFLEGDDSQK